MLGVALLVLPFAEWRASNFGPLDYPVTMRWAIPGATLIAGAFQTILSSFFVSILGMQKR